MVVVFVDDSIESQRKNKIYSALRWNLYGSGGGDLSRLIHHHCLSDFQYGYQFISVYQLSKQSFIPQFIAIVISSGSHLWFF